MQLWGFVFVLFLRKKLSYWFVFFSGNPLGVTVGHTFFPLHAHLYLLQNVASGRNDMSRGSGAPLVVSCLSGRKNVTI